MQDHDGEDREDGDDRDEEDDDREQENTNPPSGRTARRRTHALFPRGPGAGPETRDIRYIGLQRKLTPAEAKRVGYKIEYCPMDFAADDLVDWAAVYARFGGGLYKVCAKDAHGQILCWSPAGEGNWYYMAGRSKPLAEDVEPEEEVAGPPAPAPPPPPPPPAGPTFDLGSVMLGFAKMQQESADRQMQMMSRMSEQTNHILTALLSRSEPSNQLLTTLLNRHEPRVPAAPAVDPLAGVKLGVEMTKAAQPAAVPAPAPAVDPIVQLKGTIEIMKEMQGLAPTGGGGGATDAAEVSTIFSGLTTLMNNLKGSSAAAEAAPSAQSKVLLNGRYLTAEQAALEYSRLMAGPPPVPSPPAPAQSVPAPATAPPVAPAAASAPTLAPVAAAPPSPTEPAPAAPVAVEQEVEAVLARLRDPVFAEKFGARVATTQTASPPSAAPPSTAGSAPPPSPSHAAPPSTAPTSPAPSVAAPSHASPPASAPPGPPSPLAGVPPELLGHVANLDTGQFLALAKMHPEAIARSVRGLQGMDDEKAKMFGEAIGALPPDALPLLSRALPAEARRLIGLTS